MPRPRVVDDPDRSPEPPRRSPMRRWLEDDDELALDDELNEPDELEDD